MPWRRSISFATTRAPRRAWGAVAGALVVGALVGGCTSGQAQPDPYASITDEPVDDPTAVTTVTPSPTADIYAAPADAYVKPVRPAILDGKPSEDAAIAFAKYYLRLYNYAYLTGDADDLDALARPGCVFCEDVADDLAREYGAGGHDEGGLITIQRVSATDYDVNGFYVVKAHGLQAPNRELDSTGETVVDNPVAKKGLYEFGLYWSADAGWQLGELAVTAK